MEKSYYVYIHTNLTNNKKYIGITCQEPKLRWGHNGNTYKGKCPVFWNAIQKYGWNGFSHEIVASDLTREEACDMEIELIKEYQTQERKFGYNILEGGTAPAIPPEVREKMSKAMMGNKNGLGKPCSEEKKKKISDAQKGRKLTEEHKKLLSLAKKGTTHAPPSEETRRKISDAHKKKPVICKETGVVYPSIQQCARELGIEATCICACCRGRTKSIKGLHFEYYEAA